METKTIRKHIAIILALFTAIFFLAGCGSSEPAEKVYLEDTEIDAALSDGDSYKGKYINIAGKVFSIDKDGDTVAMQVWYDVENADQQFIVYADKETASDVKEDDFIKVDGKKSRRFIGEHDIGSDHIAAILIVTFQVIEDDTFVYSDKALVRTIDTLVLLLIANALYPFISASRDIAACTGINVIETLCVYIFSADKQRFEQFNFLIGSGVFIEFSFWLYKTALP